MRLIVPNIPTREAICASLSLIYPPGRHIPGYVHPIHTGRNIPGYVHPIHTQGGIYGRLHLLHT